MAELRFKQLRFAEIAGKVKVSFLKNYYFFLDKKELENVGEYALSKDGQGIIFFCNEKRAHSRFNILLEKGFNNLYSAISGKKAVYIHKNSGIPLIGSAEFGLVDRGTSCIEVKPVTGCNLNCIYCSVDEGKDSKKQVEYVVEREYLVEEFKKIAAIKKGKVEAHIGIHGEPTLYPELVELVRDLRNIEKVSVISFDSNGTGLTEELIDKLVEAGLTRMNISLNTLDQERANKLAGTYYPLKHVLRMIEYANGKLDICIAPLFIPGYNDDIKSIGEIAGFSERIKSKFPSLGIQNFLEYKGGRGKGIKQLGWDEFFGTLREYGEKLGKNLIISLDDDFLIKKDVALKKPFKKKEIIEVELKMPGRNKGSFVGVACRDGECRSITVRNCRNKKAGDKVKVQLTRTKHNIFGGVALK